MVDEVLRSSSDAFPHDTNGDTLADPVHGPVKTPWGFAARYSPGDLAGYWIEIHALGAGRTGVLLGCCADPPNGERLLSDARATLLATADPTQSLSGMAGSIWSAACAVIDGDTIGYCSRGQAVGAVAAPGLPPMVLDCTAGRPATAPLRPGATVLLCSGPVGEAASILEAGGGMHPEQLADRVILGLNGCAMVLYRHPPEPLIITVPAEPASLSVTRGRLREWLTATGIDIETCADILLAAGEATANSTEHAVINASGQVDITLTARVKSDGLRLSVSDNGRWKPAVVSSGHRGHGIHLMNALANSVDLATGPEGTTVTMVKELTR